MQPRGADALLTDEGGRPTEHSPAAPVEDVDGKTAEAKAFVGYPTAEGQCATDDDCGLACALRTDPDLTGCCCQCNVFEAGTRAWVASAVAACREAGACSDPLNCPATAINPFIAACRQGECVVLKNPAVW